VADLMGARILELDAAIKNREEVLALTADLNLVGQVGFKSLGGGAQTPEDEELAALKAERTALCAEVCTDPFSPACLQACRSMCAGGGCACA
jgi:hypothetical protein